MVTRKNYTLSFIVWPHCKQQNVGKEQLTLVIKYIWVSGFIDLFLNSRLPINEVKEFFEEETNARKEDYQNAVLREALQKLPFYSQKKEVLQKLAKEKSLDHTGTKLDVAMRIAKADKIEVKTKQLYNGRKRSIPSFSSQVRKLGKNYCAISLFLI